MPCRTRRSGFTLVELTCVLAVVAILTSLALPSYQGVVRKTRRTEAQAALLELALRQQRWRADHPSYADAARELGQTGRIDRYYRFEMFDVTPTSFTVQAAAVAGAGQEHDRQGGVVCTPLRIDQSGRRFPVDCW